MASHEPAKAFSGREVKREDDCGQGPDFLFQYIQTVLQVAMMTLSCGLPRQNDTLDAEVLHSHSSNCGSL